MGRILTDRVGDGRATMQKTYPRTNPAPFGASENSNVVQAPQIEEALRERPEHSSFGTIILANNICAPELRARIDEIFRYFARRPSPHFQIVEARECFNSRMRDSFSRSVAEALDQVRFTIINNPYAPNVTGKASVFQSLPTVNGPGRIA
jgi:hypothetical protein